jgi:hypothetical protein
MKTRATVLLIATFMVACGKGEYRANRSPSVDTKQVDLLSVQQPPPAPAPAPAPAPKAMNCEMDVGFIADCKPTGETVMEWSAIPSAKVCQDLCEAAALQQDSVGLNCQFIGNPSPFLGYENRCVLFKLQKGALCFGSFLNNPAPNTQKYLAGGAKLGVCWPQ